MTSAAHPDGVYQRLIQSITGYGIYILDPDGYITTWNAGAQKAKGYSAQEVLGCHFGLFYSDGDRDAEQPALNLAAARSHGKFETEAWRVRKDGTRFWAHVVIDALFDPAGKLFGFAKVTRDCTDQRQMRHKAQEQEQRERFIAQGANDYAIYMLDVNGVVTNWNVGAEKAKGHKASEIVGRHFSCFYTQEERLAGVPMVALETAKAHGKYQTEGWQVRKNGDTFWAHVVIDPIYDDGTLFGFAMVTRNCTEMRRLLAQTQEQEQHFRLLVEGVTDYAIYMLDVNGIVSNWNAGAQRAKGYVAAEIVGSHFSTFYTEEDRLSGLPQRGLETARMTGKFDAEGWRVRKDGSRFWAHVLIQPIYADDGALFGYSKITRDCTEQRRTSAALARTTQNLDLALTNMLQGLCLFDARGKLVLSNRRFSDILQLPPDALSPGTRLSVVLQLIADIGRKAAKENGDGDEGSGPGGSGGAHTHAANPVVGSEDIKCLRRALLGQTWRTDSSALANNQARTHPVAFSAPAPSEDGDARSTPASITAELVHLQRNILVVTRFLASGGWVSTVEDVTEQRVNEKRIHHLAHHDVLTGLPNRFSFHERIRRLGGNTSFPDGFALLYLDLDRFKPVNDTLGHHIGDELLRAVARRLSTILKRGEQLARLGGDEFTIVTNQCHTLDNARLLAKRCINALVEPFDIAGNEISIGVSIGVVSQAHGEGGFDQENLLQQADLALYSAKREGRNCYRLYETGMHVPQRERNEIGEALRHAMAAGDLKLHYQPIVDFATGRTTACEALIRWHHPERGEMAPAEFIPIAEERGLMPRLGEWILRRACADAALWPAHIRLCVNISPMQLMDAEFADILNAALVSAKLAPERLELDITEAALMGEVELPRRVLQSLRCMNVGVAMDDFGTGFSSLSLLQSFPFTRIKIDRSFIDGLGTNPNAMAIVRSVTGLCRSLGIATIAEGVETAAQHALLIGEHCTEYQGFLASQAVPNSDLEHWLTDQPQISG